MLPVINQRFTTQTYFSAGENPEHMMSGTITCQLDHFLTSRVVVLDKFHHHELKFPTVGEDQNNKSRIIMENVSHNWLAQRNG